MPNPNRPIQVAVSAIHEVWSEDAAGRETYREEQVDVRAIVTDVDDISEAVTFIEPTMSELKLRFNDDFIDELQFRCCDEADAQWERLARADALTAELLGIAKTSMNMARQVDICAEADEKVAS